MIPTLEDVIIYSDDFIDIINYDTSYLVYEDVLLIKSLNDLNKYQMVDRVLFMQKYCKGDFDYLLDDAEFRYINKNYNNLNLFTFINSVNNNFSLKPFLNEEQLKSILAIKKEDAAWSYNSSITSDELSKLNKTQKKLSTKLGSIYTISKKDKEYVRLGPKLSYINLQQHWKYLHSEINYYNYPNQLISYVALEMEYAWAFFNELFYLIDLYLKSLIAQKKSIAKYKARIIKFIQDYLMILLIDIQLPTVRICLIRSIVDECEDETDYNKKRKLIEQAVQRYKYVKGQVVRFQSAMKALVKTPISIEKNMMRTKINNYKKYYCPRQKTKCSNIEYNVSLFFEAVEGFK
ncbi:ACP synthase [Staphylococcus xylosus]|uniref:ACP synthase n=2 Tax=Staphylococcus TaxID=1279 RepID=A0A2T4LRL2_9STAP|nr:MULTISPECIES: ACP synthase [Staphylococcus]MBF7020805.1 ACP synthase [Staphylococcus kloosii]MCD8863922.1 ACP synthase [Staphylococcus arlettae]MCD8917171.1 ACP synthase [Staphylococcus gallinarum]HDH4244971.1 ACP synthase [Staphylococcus aureus]MCD8879304.1 ACP synthase [Staphylococcus kloosii]